MATKKVTKTKTDRKGRGGAPATPEGTGPKWPRPLSGPDADCFARRIDHVRRSIDVERHRIIRSAANKTTSGEAAILLRGMAETLMAIGEELKNAERDVVRIVHGPQPPVRENDDDIPF